MVPFTVPTSMTFAPMIASPFESVTLPDILLPLCCFFSVVFFINRILLPSTAYTTSEFLKRIFRTSATEISEAFNDTFCDRSTFS